jgi:hypothetical protein
LTSLDIAPSVQTPSYRAIAKSQCTVCAGEMSASGGGVVCAGFVMHSVPPKVGSDAARIPVTGPLVGLFEAYVIASRS